MSRWVVPENSGLKSATGTELPADGPAARVVKYVPAEVVTAFMVVYSAAASATLPEDKKGYIAVGLIVLFLGATFGHVARNAPPGPVRKAHLIVAPIAFVVWSYPIASALLGPWFIPWIALLGQAAVVAASLAITPRTS